MSVLTGVLIGLLFPVLYVYAGRAWAILYGVVFIAAVGVFDARGDLTEAEVAWLLVAFASAAFMAWRMVGTERAAHRA